MSDLRLSDRISVHDGDTPIVNGERMRLVFGDAPEVADERKQQPAAVGSGEARQALAQAMLDGYELRSKGVDRYGRTLFDGHKPGSPTLANEMAANGLTLPSHWKTIDDAGSAEAQVRAGADSAQGIQRDSDYFTQLGQQARDARLNDLTQKLQSGAMASSMFAIGDNSDPRKDEDSTAFGSSFVRGVDNTQSMLYGFAEALGSAAGVDVLADWGREGVARNVVEAMRNPARVETYEDIDGYTDAMIYGLEAVGEFAPQLLVDLGIGVVTGGAAVLTKEALAAGGKALMRRAGSSATAASADVAKAGWKAFAPAAKVGAFTSAYMQNTGETQNQYRVEGIDAPGEALLIGAGKAALDYAGLDITLRQAFKGFNKADAGDALKLGDWLKSSVGATLTAFSAESVTEGAQTLMDELAIQSHKPEYEVNWTHVVDAMLKGGIGGGVVGGAGHAVAGLSSGKPVAAEGGSALGTDTDTGVDTSDPLADKLKAGMGNTTPTPEPNGDLAAQVAHPNKPVTYIPPANREDVPAILEEVTAQGVPVHTKELDNGGTLVANDPAAFGGVSSNPTSGELATLLQMDADRASLPASDDNPAVVVRDTQGRVLHSEVTTPERAEAVAANLQQRFPGEKVEVTTPQAVVTDRAARRLPIPGQQMQAPAVGGATQPAAGPAVQQALEAPAKDTEEREQQLRAALTEAGLDPEKFVKESADGELMLIDTANNKPSELRTRDYARRAVAGVVDTLRDIVDGKASVRPEFPPAVREALGIPTDAKGFKGMKEALGKLPRGWEAKLATHLQGLSFEQLHSTVRDMRLSILEKGQDGRSLERVGRGKRQSFDTAGAAAALQAMAPAKRVPLQESTEPTDMEAVEAALTGAKEAKAADATPFTGRLRAELENNELAREALYSTRRGGPKALRRSAAEAWQALKLTGKRARQELAEALAVMAEELRGGQGQMTTGVIYHKDEQAFDDDAYTAERTAAFDNVEVAEQIMQVERLAAGLLRSDVSPRTRARMIREAVRLLMPPETFGLRRTTRTERAAGDGHYTATLSEENSQRISRMADTGELVQAVRGLLITAVIRRVTGDGTYTHPGAQTLLADPVYGHRAMKGLSSRAVDALWLSYASDFLATRLPHELSKVSEEGDTDSLPERGVKWVEEQVRTGFGGELSPESTAEVLEVRLNERLDAFQQATPDGGSLLDTLADYAVANSEAASIEHNADPDVSARRSFAFFALFSRVFPSIPAAVKAKWKRRQGQRSVFETHRVVGFDFETFFDTKAGYSLQAMGADAYIRDPRFKVQMMTVSEQGKPSRVLRTEGEIRAFLSELRDGDKPVLMAAHNARFDARILRDVFGFVPEGDSRLFDTFELFRAAVPEQPHGNGTHRLADLYEYLRAEGASDVPLKAKDSAALDAVDGVRDLDSLPPEVLKALIDYAGNDSELVLRGIEHFDPDTTPGDGFVDMTDRVLRADLDPNVDINFDALAGTRRSPDATNNTLIAKGKNLIMLDYRSNGEWLKARFDLVRLAMYAQGGEAAPRNAREAFINLNANLARLMGGDLNDGTTGDLPITGVQAAGYLAPDRVFYIDGAGRPVTVGDALAEHGAVATREGSASKLEQRREEIQQKLALLERMIRPMIRLLLEGSGGKATTVDAIMAWDAELAGESMQDELSAAAKLTFKEVGARRLNPLHLGATAKDLQDATGGSTLSLYEFKAARGELLGELGGIARSLRDLPTRYTDDRDSDERAEAALRKENEYLPLEDADRLALKEEQRMGMATAVDIDDDVSIENAQLDVEAATTAVNQRQLADELGRELALRDPAYQEQVTKLEQKRGSGRGTSEGRPDSGAPAPKKASIEASRRTQALLRVLRRQIHGVRAQYVAPTVAQARAAAAKMLIGPRWGGLHAGLRSMVERFMAEMVVQGVPVSGARIVAYTTSDVRVDPDGTAQFAADFRGGAQRMILVPGDDEANSEIFQRLAARAKNGGSFYVNTKEGPFIFIDRTLDAGPARLRIARQLQDLAHEVGHLVFDRTFDSLTEEEQKGLKADMNAALPGTEGMEGQALHDSLHEFFAHKFVEAASRNIEQALDGLSAPVQTVLRALVSLVRNVWSSLVALKTHSAPTFDAFAQRIFAGEYAMSYSRPRSSAAARAASGIRRVSYQLTHQRSASGLHGFVSGDGDVAIAPRKKLRLPEVDFTLEFTDEDIAAQVKAYPDVDLIPMGHVFRMIDGLEPTTYRALIDGQPAADIVLQIDPATGEVVALNDIKVHTREKGHGERIIRGLLASRKTPLLLIDCVNPSRGFWDKMGVTFYDGNDDAQLTWDDYERTRAKRDEEARRGSELGGDGSVREAVRGSEQAAGVGVREGAGDLGSGAPEGGSGAREGGFGEYELVDDEFSDDDLAMFGIVRDAAGIQQLAKTASQRLTMAATQARQGWKDGRVASMWRSVASQAQSRIAHFDPLLARQLFQAANTDSTGVRAFEQNHRALKARMTGLLLQVREQLGAEKLQAGFDELASGKALTEVGEAAKKILTDLQGAAKEAGLKSVLFRAAEPPLVFDREVVGKRQNELELLLARKGMPAEQVRQVLDGILHSDALPDTNMAPGLPVGEHVSTHALTRFVSRQELQQAGFLLAQHEQALFHWIEGVSRRAAWDSAFGAYGRADSSVGMRYFGEEKLSAAHHRELVEAGILRKDGAMFHTNAKFVERLDMVEKVHGQSARREVLELVNGALGRHPMGLRMPDGYRRAQDTVLSWLARTILMWSGVASVPELGLSLARVHGRVPLAGAFKGWSDARAFAKDMGVVMAHSTEYLAWATDQYQTPLNRKIDRWFFLINGNKLVTDTSRVLSLAVGSQYLLRMAKEGDHAALARLNVTAEQVLTWEAAGRPRWSMDQSPLERQNTAAVVDALNQFVGEASLAPSRFQATHWGNNPYMRVIWQLKHFLYTYGDTVLGNIWREGKRRFKGDTSKLMVMTPALVLLAATLPLGLASGEARDWLRRINGDKSLYAGESATTDRLVDGVFYSGLLGPLDILFGMARQAGWGNVPGAIGPSLGVAWRSVDALNIGDDNRDADFAAAARVLIPVVSQNKGLWPVLHLD